MVNLEEKLNGIFDNNELSKTNRYLLASIFKKRPLRNDLVTDGKLEG